MQLQWSHAFVLVRDMDAMVEFYTNVLGFEVTDTGGLRGNKLVFLSQVGTDHHQLGFQQTREDMGSSNTVGHFAFRVASLNDVKSMHGTVKSDARVSDVRPVTHGNAWSVYFKDPEGNGIEVFCDTPWHVNQPQATSWDPAMPDKDIYEATKKQFASAEGFIPINDFYATRTAHLRERERTTS